MNETVTASEKKTRKDRAPLVEVVGYLCLLINALLFTADIRTSGDSILAGTLLVLHVSAMATLLIGMAYYYLKVLTKQLDGKKDRRVYRPYLLGGWLYLLGGILLVLGYYLL